MCGIAGFICKSQIDYKRNKHQIVKMTNQLISRGPDDNGFWMDNNLGVALGHRRLSIIDLSRFGRQPMVSNSGRYVMSFNGEIYNHQEIRKKLS